MFEDRIDKRSTMRTKRVYRLSLLNLPVTLLYIVVYIINMLDKK